MQQLLGPSQAPCTAQALPGFLQDGVTTSLDGLRSGNCGERIPRDAISSGSLFTNDFLP